MLKRAVFFFFFLFKYGKKGKTEKLQRRILFTSRADRKNETVGMLPNTRWEAAYPITMCASRLAYLDILRAFQTFMECN